MISNNNSIRCLVVTLLVAVQLLWASEGFSPAPKMPAASSPQDTSVFYRNPQDVTDGGAAVTLPTTTTTTTEEIDQTTATTTTKKVSSKKKKKPTIYNLKTLDDLQYFLEDDDRLVAIKFYAPWCKSCQRLGQHFQKLAIELGDGIVDRQKVRGSIRFAQVEYSDETRLFLTEQLQIRQVPTLQLYHQQRKLYEEAGMTNVKGLQAAVQALPTDAFELMTHAEEVDDGILEAAIDEAFYESPSFLNEEW